MHIISVLKEQEKFAEEFQCFFFTIVKLHNTQTIVKFGCIEMLQTSLFCFHLDLSLIFLMYV